MAFPDAWQEFAIISIQELGGTEYNFMAITESINILEGAIPGESVFNTAGESVWNQFPQEDGEIVLQIYPIEVDEDNNSGLFQQWAGGAASSGEPSKTDVTWGAGNIVRDRFRVAILWTNDSTATSASGATNSSSISGIDGDTTTITVDTSSAHGLSAGDTAIISGTTNYNGTFKVATVTDSDTFTISSTAHNFASESAGTVGSDSLRFSAIECRITSHKTEFRDKILKTTVSFKFPAIVGTQRNWRWESANQASLDNLASYTSNYEYPT